MRGLLGIYHFLRNEFDQFNNPGTHLLDSCLSFDTKILSKHGLWEENTNIMSANAA